MIHVHTYRRLRTRKGITAIQGCSIENQKGGDSALLVLNGTSLNSENALLALNWQYNILALYVVCANWPYAYDSHRRAPRRVGGQTWHCHVRHRQACSQRTNPCMPYRRAGPGPRTDWEAERHYGAPMCSASTTRARSATSLDPQHGVVVLETWHQCIRSICSMHIFAHFFLMVFFAHFLVCNFWAFIMRHWYFLMKFRNCTSCSVKRHAFLEHVTVFSYSQATPNVCNQYRW